MNEIYYYTDFDTFKLIMKNGTLRFKESTKSNDMLDTNILYEELKEIFTARYANNKTNLNAQIQFLKGFFETEGYQNKSIPVVACFTEKGDSRLFWDAYTMHRKGRESNRYNGVCIKINRDQLCNAIQMECKDNDLFIVGSVIYDKNSRRGFLNNKVDGYDKRVKALSEESNQEQDIIPEKRIILPSGRRSIEIKLKKCIVLPMMEFINNLQVWSPLFKHEFWNEEVETRACLCKQTMYLQKLSDGTHYYDVHISNDVFEEVILGPEFSEEDMRILSAQENILDINKIKFIKSLGTGVITSDN